jgi:AraC-like DNA-binding protein
MGAATPAAPVDFDEFRDVVSRSFVPLDTTTDLRTGFRGAMHTAQLGAIQVTEVRADRHRVRRTPKLIRQTEPDYFKLMLPFSGVAMLTQDDREARVPPGHFVLYDTTRPYQLVFDDYFALLVVMFPRHLLPLPARDLSALTAVPMSGERGTGALVHSFLRQVAEHLDEYEPAAGVRLSTATIDLLAAAFAASACVTNRLPPHTRQSAMLSRLQAYIEEHLADPRLTPSEIAAANHISVRYLQKLFEDTGRSVTGYVRVRRLERCRADLVDPALANLLVGTVAARWGFDDPAHFSRLFRAAYDCSPRDYRHGGATSRPAAAVGREPYA